MMQNIKRILITLVVLWNTQVQAQEVLSLDEILSRIEQNNPGLKAFDSQVKGLDAKVAGAKAWMAPMVGAGTFMTPYPGAGMVEEDDKGAYMFSAEQDIPNPAK